MASCVIKDVERLGHLQHFLNAVLYADNAPKAAENKETENKQTQRRNCAQKMKKGLQHLCAGRWQTSAAAALVVVVEPPATSNAGP